MVRYEQFGAHDDGGRIRFGLYVPGPDEYRADLGGPAHIAAIEAYGTFQEPLTGQAWDLTRTVRLEPAPFEGGTLFRAVTDPVPLRLYEYKYRVSFDASDGHPVDQRIVNDPCARYGVGELENSGVVVGGSRPEDNVVSSLPRRLPPSDLVIYELFLEDFTRDYRGDRAPLDAVVDKLDRIRDLGFTAVEFMPWTAWVGGGFNWGYLPYLYYSVEHRYAADPSDPLEQLSVLKKMISACRERGLHVIMDAVFNHVEIGDHDNRGLAYHWLWRDPADCPFTGEYGPGGYGTELDFHNRCTEDFIVGTCRYWIDTFGIDGLRLDFTKGYYGGSAEHGLPKVSRAGSDGGSQST
jgi:pullulanase